MSPSASLLVTLVTLQYSRRINILLFLASAGLRIARESRFELPCQIETHYSPEFLEIPEKFENCEILVEEPLKILGN